MDISWIKFSLENWLDARRFEKPWGHEIIAPCWKYCPPEVKLIADDASSYV